MKARILLASAALAGCSFVFVQGAPSEPAPSGHVECTNSDFWPMIDSMLVGVHALDLSLVVGNTFKLDQNGSYDAVVATSATLLFVHAIAAIYGFVRTSNCEEMMEQVAAKQRYRRYIYRPVEPTPPPPVPPPPPEVDDGAPPAEEQP